MAFAGLKKQINKANQYMTEKMGGAEGTKLDYDFMEMERKTDVTVELVEELQTKTKEYLQPNPTARARMQAVKGISKLSGQAKSNTYPQPEGTLAECMLTYGKKLGDDSIFAQALIEMGDSLKQMADVKYALDDRVKQNFLEPLHSLQTKDLKEVMHHRKKLQGRRLDFDCKRRRQAKGSNITDDEIRGAEEKFAESWQLAQMGMYNLLENDVEQVSQLCVFAEAMYEYHEQCTDLLKVLVEVLNQKREEAEGRPKSDFQPKTLADLNVDAGSMHGSDGVNAFSHISAKTNNPIMYSSQQNLSTLATTNDHPYRSNYNRNVNNINSSKNNNNNQKVYGSQQSLSTASNRSTSFNSNSKLSNNMNNNNINNNNNYNNSSSITNNNVDSWLNAWDNPNPPIPATRTAVVPKQNHKNYSKQFSDPWSGGSSNLNSPVNKPTHLDIMGNGGQAQARSTNASPLPSPMRSPAKTPNPQVGPCCTALYDFEPENPGELGFKENDVIQLINKVDENWYEGSVRGRTGYFPQSYVTVTVPLP